MAGGMDRHRAVRRADERGDHRLARPALHKAGLTPRLQWGSWSASDFQHGIAGRGDADRVVGALRVFVGDRSSDMQRPPAARARYGAHRDLFTAATYLVFGVCVWASEWQLRHSCRDCTICISFPALIDARRSSVLAASLNGHPAATTLSSPRPPTWPPRRRCSCNTCTNCCPEADCRHDTSYGCCALQ